MTIEDALFGLHDQGFRAVAIRLSKVGIKVRDLDGEMLTDMSLHRHRELPVKVVKVTERAVLVVHDPTMDTILLVDKGPAGMEFEMMAEVML
jgi:hypothetical protein